MKTLNYNGEKHHLRTKSEEAFYSELVRQFGRNDAAMLGLAPAKYKHQFDEKTLAAYASMLAQLKTPA